MPRLKNVVPKYRKHKQSGQAIVTLKTKIQDQQFKRAGYRDEDRTIGRPDARRELEFWLRPRRRASTA